MLVWRHYEQISGLYAITARDVVTFLFIIAKCLLLYLHIFTCTYRGTHTQAHMYNLSESFCDSDMCRPWLIAVTLGVDYSLVNWEMLRVYSLGIFPAFIGTKQ